MIRIGLVCIFVVVVLACWLNRGQASDSRNLLKSPSDLRYWRWDQNNSSGGVTRDHGGLRCDILVDSGVESSLRLYQTTAKLQDRRIYRIVFEAKSSSPRSIHVSAFATGTAQEPVSPVTQRASFFIDTKWRQYDMLVQPHGANGKTCAAPMFEMGNTGQGSIWLKNILILDMGPAV
jgi:hypothetical protein